MKFLLIIATFFTLTFSSEYVSLHPTNLVDYFVNKGAGVEDVAEVSYVANIKLLKDAARDSEGWYAPSGWQSYKAYYPPGTSYSTLLFTARPNSSYRVHLTFKADDDKTIDHYSAEPTTTFLKDKETREFRVRNVGSMLIDSAMINASDGGWLYIDIIEDAANLASDFGDQNPSIDISIRSQISDKARFNAWKNGIDLLADGRPGDAVDTLTIIDKRANSTKVTKIITMDPAIDPNGDEDQDGSLNKDDCDDYNAAIHPQATDIPNNGIDEDCSGTDAIDLTILDNDADTYMADVDCDDSNPNVHPGAQEIANNGIDDDCDENSLYDGTLDIDGDTYAADDECDDGNANIHPGATDIANNGIDEDCSGEDLVNLNILDQDGDGFTPAQGDCNDNNRLVHPGATEIGGNGIDDDCTGGDAPRTTECQWFEACSEGPKPQPKPVTVDNDGDGYNSDVDCNDNDSAINPDAFDIAGNGIDEDCSGKDTPKPQEVEVDRKREAEIAAPALKSKAFTFKGVFSYYKFYSDEAEDYKNWVFIDPVGTTYQLLGNAPTDKNAFGWKKIEPLQDLERNWYMFTVDIDGDGEFSRFEWVLVSANPKDNLAYKLAGVNNKGSFLYSERIDVTYTLVNGQVVEFD